VSDDFNKDDLARLLALEYAFSALALISASNFAKMQGLAPGEAVGYFPAGIESSLYDTSDMGTETRELVRMRLRRMFDHVATMAEEVTRGPSG
jgi:hypothetical protein